MMNPESQPASLNESDPESITLLAPLPSDPNFISVRVGRKSVAKLRASDVESLGLKVGGPWTPHLAAQVERIIEMDRARRRAMQLLGRRAYSRHELAERLSRHQADASLVQAVLDELQDSQWIDDEAFARQFAEEINRRQPAGAELLLHKLQQRGIADDLARQVVSNMSSVIDPLEAAESLARERLATMGTISPAVQIRRLSSLLARRGFGNHIVEEVIQRLKLVDED